MIINYMIFIKILASLAIGGLGLYFLTHVQNIAQKWQGFYIKLSEKNKESKLFFYNPENWRKPSITFIFKVGVIFLGILLIIIAYPVIFGPIYF